MAMSHGTKILASRMSNFSQTLTGWRVTFKGWTLCWNCAEAKLADGDIVRGKRGAGTVANMTIEISPGLPQNRTPGRAARQRRLLPCSGSGKIEEPVGPHRQQRCRAAIGSSVQPGRGGASDHFIGCALLRRVHSKFVPSLELTAYCPVSVSLQGEQEATTPQSVENSCSPRLGARR